ncbi:Phosphoglycolate phosphatase [Durusdinium trenchii]|uniref:Phosphoglycolate phosphatase n=1 Tax=Durusdinium trenchii TaxID=1381693 RepID=A0ABP0RDY2_9DINO
MEGEVPVAVPSFTYASDTVIEFITDVEGNWEYFLRLVYSSQVLFWDDEERGDWGPGILRLKENGMLVFGGDAPDKGPGDIRLVKILLSLKRRYPEQVFFILGNRDIMKLRFASELKEVEEPGKVWLPTWDPKVKTFAPWTLQSSAVQLEEQFLQENPSLQRDEMGKLKWLLHCTMGCQDWQCKDPWMLEFIRVAKIAHIIGDILFLHGGICTESYGQVPSRDGRCRDVQEWVTWRQVKELNAWKDRQVQDRLTGSGLFSGRVANAQTGGPGVQRGVVATDFCEQPYFYEKDGKQCRGGDELIIYGTPGDGNPTLRSLEVQNFLKGSGIDRVVSALGVYPLVVAEGGGHQPHGQTPTVVRHPKTGLLMITADTSRSDNKASKIFNPADNRGIVYSSVRLLPETVEIEGQLADGRYHRCSVHRTLGRFRLRAGTLGRSRDAKQDGSWVKTILTSPSEPAVHLVQTALGKGFNVKVCDMSEHTACLQLREEFKTSDILRVKIRDFRGGSTSAISLEDCRDGDLTSAHFKDRSDRDFTVNTEEFYRCDTFIFAMMGVFGDPKTPLGIEITKRVNDLIFKGKRVIWITNNSNKTRTGLMKELEDYYGIKVFHTSLSRTLSPDGWQSEPDPQSELRKLAHLHVVTSSFTCAWFLNQKGLQRPFVITSNRSICEELEGLGINKYVATIGPDGKPKKEYLEEVTSKKICDLVAKYPDVDSVVICWDQHFTALKIAVATQYLKWAQDNGQELPVITCSMDRSGILGVTEEKFCFKQGYNGKKIRAIGNGVMAASIVQSSDIDEEIVDVGKPSLMLLEQLRRPREEGGMGVDFSRAVVVGSTLKTDIELANGGGMKSLLVLSN